MKLDDKIRQAIKDNKIFLRSLSIRSEEIEENGDRRVPVSFSSEQMVEQWWGKEVLSHEEGAVDLSLMADNRAPCLLNHWGEQIGVVENARIDDKRGYADLRFSKGQRGQEIYQDILDGIRSQISVGYFIREYKVENVDTDDELYRITKWQPREVSVVKFAADQTVGVGRGDLSQTRYFLPEDSIMGDKTRQVADDPTKGLEPDEDKVVGDLEGQRGEPEGGVQDDDKVVDGDPDGDPQAQDILDADRTAKNIFDIGHRAGHVDLAVQAISEGLSVVEFAERLAGVTGEGGNGSPPVIGVGRGDRAVIKDEDKRNFSLTSLFWRMQNPQATGTRGGLELELSEDHGQRLSQEGHHIEGFAIPHELLAPRHSAERALSAGTDTAGGHLVETDVLTDSFIDLLLEDTVALRRCTRLTDLKGDVTIPGQDARAAATFVGETGEVAEQNPTFRSISLSPKHAGAYIVVSNQLLHQSNMSVEDMLRRDLARAVAKVTDQMLLAGTGSNNQPTGIKSTTGISSLTYPKTGGTPAGTITYDKVLEAEEKLADANALEGQLAWIIAPDVRKAARQKPKLGTGTSIPIYHDGKIDEYDADVTTQVDDNEGYLGNWDDLVAAFWGSIVFLIDPYVKALNNQVRIIAREMMDVAVRHPKSFVHVDKAA